LGHHQVGLLATLRLADRFLFLTYLGRAPHFRSDNADEAEMANIDIYEGFSTMAQVGSRDLEWLGSSSGGSLSPGVAQHAFSAPREGVEKGLTFSCRLDHREFDWATWEIRFDIESPVLHMLD
jgi:hypothetical protein